MSTSNLHVVVDQLRSSYVNSLNEKLLVLKAAVSERRFREVTQYAHQLKGSGASYGFPEISDLGAQIEEAGQGHQGTVLESLLVELDRVVRRMKENAAGAL